MLRSRYYQCWAINSDDGVTLQAYRIGQPQLGPIKGANLEEVIEKIDKYEGASIDLQKFARKNII
ncbi:MAG: hypothetical protein HPY81_10425 [Firmicutes bacterium]|nr:hypothetical protein [Bacillota bacterium]